ncbi:MAG: hypothetical protein Q9210_007571, partial [Variospora velana]
CAGEEAADAAAEGDKAEEEGADGEEETDEDEGESETGFEVEFPSTVPRILHKYSFLSGRKRIARKGGVVPKAHIGVEIPVGVKGIRRTDSRADIVSVNDAAGAPEDFGSVAEAGGVSFKEVKLVGWVPVDCAAEKGEEDEEACSGDED